MEQIQVEQEKLGATSFPGILSETFRGDFFNALPDEEKPLYMESVRQNFISSNGIKEKDDIDYINRKAEETYKEYRQNFNLPRFTPNPEQASELYGKININPSDPVDKRIQSIEDWRDNVAPSNVDKFLPANKEDVSFHIEDLANNLIKSELAKDSYKPGGMPDFLTDSAKRFTEQAIKGLGVDLLADYKEANRFFAKNLVENPEFDDNYGSQVIGGLGNVLSQVAFSAAMTAAGAPELVAPTLLTMSTARHMTEAYNRELKRTGNELVATDAAVNSITAGIIDAGPEILLGGLLNKVKGFSDAYKLATTEAAKKAVIKEYLPSVVKGFTLGSLNEGIVGGGATHIAGNLGDYYATGDEQYLKNATNIAEIANNIAVEGTVGGLVGGGITGLTKGSNQANVSATIAQLTDAGKTVSIADTKAKELKIFDAIKAGNYDKAIEISRSNVTAKTPSQASDKIIKGDAKPSLDPSGTPIKDKAEATLKERLGEVLPEQSKIRIANKPYTDVIDKTIKSLDPVKDQAKIDELNKTRSLFENEKGPIAFQEETEFESNDTSFVFKPEKDYAKQTKKPFDVTLEDDTKLKNDNVVYVKQEGMALVKNANLIKALGKPVTFQTSPNGRVVKFKGQSKKYEASPNPQVGWVPVVVTGNKIKILAPVREANEVATKEPAEAIDPAEVKPKTSLVDDSEVADISAAKNINITNINDLIKNGGGIVSVEENGRKVDFDKFAIGIDGNSAEVLFVELNQKERGKKLGKASYIALGNNLLEKGIILQSSKAQYANGNSLWKSLAKEGYATRGGQGVYTFKQQAPVVETETIDQTRIDEATEKLNKNTPEGKKVVAPKVKKPSSRKKKKAETPVETVVEETTEEVVQESEIETTTGPNFVKKEAIEVKNGRWEVLDENGKETSPYYASHKSKEEAEDFYEWQQNQVFYHGQEPGNYGHYDFISLKGTNKFNLTKASPSKNAVGIIIGEKNPWQRGEDGILDTDNLLPGNHGYIDVNGKQELSKPTIVHKNGWTALAFVDRTSDKRTGAHGAFFTHGTLSIEEMLDRVDLYFPGLVENKKIRDQVNLEKPEPVLPTIETIDQINETENPNETITEIDKALVFQNQIFNDTTNTEARRKGAERQIKILEAEKARIQPTVKPDQPAKPIDRGLLKQIVSFAEKGDLTISKFDNWISRGFISEANFPQLAEMYGVPSYDGDLGKFAQSIQVAIKDKKTKQPKQTVEQAIEETIAPIQDTTPVEESEPDILDVLQQEVQQFRQQTQSTLQQQRENTPENIARRKEQTDRINDLAKDVGLKNLRIVNTHEELNRADVDDSVQGFVEGSQVVMILDNIIPYEGESQVEAAERIFKHEVVGHLKLSRVLSGISQDGFNNLVTFLKTLKWKSGDSIWERTKAAYTTEVIPDDLEIVDEIFAKLTESKDKESVSIISKIVNWIRVKFLKAGIANWTTNDLDIIIQTAFDSELISDSDANIVNEDTITDSVSVVNEINNNIEEVLTTEEKSQAATELGFKKWNKEALSEFKNQISDWLVYGKTKTKALEEIFVKLVKSLKNISAAILAAISINTGDASITEIGFDRLSQSPVFPIESTMPNVNITSGFLGNINPEIIPVNESNQNVSLKESSLIKIEANFNGIKAHKSVVNTANEIINKKNNEGKPFIIGDKAGGLLYIFDANGNLKHKTPSLFGKEIGDNLTGDEKFLEKRVTPSGRFAASVGQADDSDYKYGKTLDFYESEDYTVAIHRVYLGKPEENRIDRLNSESPLDNRVSGGCINVFDSVMDDVINPLFEPEGGFVYVLPENRNKKIRFAKSHESVYANSVIRGYGAWIAPNGEVIDAAYKSHHLGKAIDIIGEEEIEGMSVDQVYSEMSKRGYLRVVNGPSILVDEKYKKPTSTQKAVLQYAGMNSDKNVIMGDKYLYKTPAMATRFSKSQTKTDDFKEWFGDWEKPKDEFSSSKVVNEKGEPLVVYHGTENDKRYTEDLDFTVFYPLSHFGTAKAANERVDLAGELYDNSINQRIYPVYLNIRNPIEMIDNGAGHMSNDFRTELIKQEIISSEAADKFTREYVQDLIKKGTASDDPSDNSERAIIALIKSLGYDGFKYTNNVEDKGSISWVALYPNQIKSATGNAGKFSNKNPDIRFSKSQPKQKAPVTEDNDLDWIVTDNEIITQSKSKASKEIAKLIKRTYEQKLIIKEVQINNAFKDVQYAFLSDNDVEAFLADYQDFVNTRNKQENPATERIPVDELEKRLIDYKKKANKNEYEFYASRVEGFPEFAFFNEDAGAARKHFQDLIQEKNDDLASVVINDSDVATMDATVDLQFQAIDIVDDIEDVINRGVVDMERSLVETGNPILDAGIPILREQVAIMRKLFNEYVLSLVTTDVTSLSGGDLRRVYYSLLSLVTDGYPNRLEGFISSETTDIIRNMEATFSDPYGTRKKNSDISKLESNSSQIERLATDGYSYDLLTRLQAPFREGLVLAKRYHEEVITPYIESLQRDIYNGVLDADTGHKIGMFGILRQRFLVETPEQALKQNVQWILDSNKNTIGVYDRDFDAQGKRHQEYLEDNFLSGINYTIEKGQLTSEFTPEDVAKFYQNANIFIGDKGIQYADGIVKMYDALKPLSKFTTEFIYGRPFEEIENYIPTMSVIVKGEGDTDFDIAKAQMLTDAKSFSSGQIFYGTNTSGLGSTKSRTRKIGTNRSLVFNINYAGESLGRIAVYDYFTAHARQEMSQLLNHKNKNGKLFAKFLGDPEQKRGRTDAFRSAMNGTWQNVMSQASYMHSYHVATNWVGRKWAQGVLSGLHQLPAQLVSNTTPYFVQHINEPHKIGNYFKAATYLLKHRMGMLEPHQARLVDKVIFEVTHRQQFQEIDKSVNLDINPSSLVEMMKKEMPYLYKAIVGVDKGIENILFKAFRLSDTLSGAPMALAEYLNAEQDSKGTHVRLEDLTYDPVSYIKAIDATERYIGVGDASRRGEYLTNKDAKISIARNLLIAFRSFSINNAVNFGKEMRRLFDSDVSREQKAQSFKYMMGIAAQSVTYTMMAYAVQYGMAAAIAHALKNPEEEEELKKLYSKSQNRMTKNERRMLNAEISMREKNRKVIQNIQNRTNNTRILSIKTVKDAASNMFIPFNLEAVPNIIIHVGSDGPEAETFKAWKKGEIDRIQKLIKRHKALENRKTVTRLNEELANIQMQEFLPAVYEQRTIANIGGSFGGTVEGIVDAIESGSKFFQKPEAISPLDFVNLAAVIGVSQPDIKRYFRASSLIEKSGKEREEQLAAYEEETSP